MRMFWCLLFIQWSSIGMLPCDLMQKESVRSGVSPVHIIAGEEALKKVKEEARMEMLHLALVKLSALQVIPEDMLRIDFGQFDPPSAANSNRYLLDRYNEWVDANSTLMPESGEAPAAFEARCATQGKTPYPGFELPRY